ncbi:MAG: hypothetical protein NC453_28390 [Muribaculum sp.]|nr:hypothetical protein [Muribaculum sp.]
MNFFSEPNLTFEEFKALACREPNLEGEWLYQVTQAIIYDWQIKNPYPRFDLSYTRTFYFKTFQEAEQFVKKTREDVYCSWVLQIPFGEASVDCEFGARWLYDHNGVLQDYTITYADSCGETCDPTNSAFFGRVDERQRFKPGDIVEVVENNEVRLAVVVQPVTSVEHCWRVYNKFKERGNFRYGLDFTDDMATVIYGPSYGYHSHIWPVNLLKPQFSIPDDILAEMQTWLKRCENESEEEMMKKCDESHAEFYNEIGEYIGECYPLNIYLHFEEQTNKPHLHINDKHGLKVGLCIDRPEYYDHGDYNGRLTNNQLKCLNEYLSEIEIGKSRWWYMLRDWNEDNDNPDLVLSLDTPLPCYLDLINK